MSERDEAEAWQGYCWPSLGEPCGQCHRCAKESHGDTTHSTTRDTPGKTKLVQMD